MAEHLHTDFACGHIGGGVFADDEKVANIDVSFTAEQLRNGVKLRKGKKVYHKALLK